MLIPRPETEELLEWICAEETESPGIVADLCTDSGCIALALRKHFPDADVFAADLSADALRKAAESELENFESARIHWIQNDLLLEPGEMPLPPYIHTRIEDDERVDFFVQVHQWAGEPFNAEPDKCDDLCWVHIKSLPANIIPYVKQALGNHLNGIPFDEYKQ